MLRPPRRGAAPRPAVSTRNSSMLRCSEHFSSLNIHDFSPPSPLYLLLTFPYLGGAPINSYRIHPVDRLCGFFLFEACDCCSPPSPRGNGRGGRADVWRRRRGGGGWEVVPSEVSFLSPLRLLRFASHSSLQLASLIFPFAFAPPHGFNLSSRLCSALSRPGVEGVFSLWLRHPT